MELDMTKGNPLHLILNFLFPVFLGNMFQQFYNMADTVIVGRFVGTTALAAVGSVGTIMFLVIGSAMGLTNGFTILTAQSLGAKDMARVKHSVTNGVLLTGVFTIALTVLSTTLMPNILHLMNTPEDIYKEAYTYIFIICMGMGASLYYNLGASYMRAIGNSKTPLYFLIFSAGINVVLDLLLIIVFHMGVAGAALATVISQGMSAILCFVYIYKKIDILRPERSDWYFSKADTKHQLHVGIPMALQYGITASGGMIMQSAINMFGSTAVASFTAATKVQGLFNQGLMALVPSIATYSGQNFGKGDYKRVQEGVKAGVEISVVYGIAAAILVNMFSKPLLGIFFPAGTDINEVLPYARTYLTMATAFYIPLGCLLVFRNTMQGCGYGILPMLGGVIEFFARMGTAVLAMHVGSYTIAVACDPATWFAAFMYTGITCWLIMRKLMPRDKRGKATHRRRISVMHY